MKFSMWQQQQSQFMSSNFPLFPNMFNAPNMMTFPSNGNFMYTGNSNGSSGQYQWQDVYSPGSVGENNKITSQHNRNQHQYASYPEGAIHRSASGPGWQQQQTFYPAHQFK